VPQQPDPWTTFLDWLTTIVVPDWGELISMLPLFVVLGVVGPGLTLLMLMQLHHVFTRQRGRVRTTEELQPAPAERDAAGDPIFPPNVPFCPRHALIFAAASTTCHLDGDELTVRCPVDGVSRSARQQVCRSCGTRYVLGASQTALTVRRQGHPPEGGAAVA
jgi:hypothetical protein